MVALPPDQAANQATGWQDMRLQLFGQQRQREAEARLIHVLGQIDASLAQATRGKSTTSDLKARTRALGALVEGANRLIAWHHEELLASRAAGVWDGAPPDTPQDILAGVRGEFPLFETATVSGGAIDCSDVIESIGHLRGGDGDAFFNDALAGAAAMLHAAYERIAADEPTAGAGAALADTWEILLSVIDGLAVPVVAVPLAEEPVAEPSWSEAQVVAALDAVDTEAAAEDVVVPEPIPSVVLSETLSIEPVDLVGLSIAVAEPVSLAAGLEDLEELEPAAPEPVVANAPTITGDAYAETPSLSTPAPAQAVVEVIPTLAARFSRIYLVAC